MFRDGGKCGYKEIYTNCLDSGAALVASDAAVGTAGANA
jgi:hypothetical protein